MHTPQFLPGSRTGRLRGSGFLALAVAATAFLVVSAGADARNARTNSASDTGSKTFIYGTQTDPGNGQCDGTQTVFVALNLNCFQLVEEPLIKLNYQTNKLEPGLAVSWSQPTPSSVILKLRPNVKFSDGTPFNADAVVYNFRRIFVKGAPGSQGASFTYASYVPFKSISKIDDMTVKVTFTNARANVLWTLSGVPVYMQSPAAVAKEGKSYGSAPVGTGPYVVTSYQANQKISLERNPDYWGTKPAPDTIVIVINSNTASLVNDLLSGQIDAMQGAPAQQLAQIKNAGFTIAPYQAAVEFYFCLNTTKPPFDDAAVRQAVNYAFNKPAVVQISQGAGVPMYSQWYKGAYAYIAPQPSYTFSRAKAAALLTKAGWVLQPGQKVRQKNGQDLSIKLAVQSNLTGIESLMSPALTSDLQAVGFKVQTVSMDSSTFFGATAGALNPATDNIAEHGMGALLPDPQSVLARWIPKDQFNFAFYNNPKYTALVNAAAKEPSVAKRTAQLKAAQVVLYQDAPLIFGFQSIVQVEFNNKKFSAVPATPNAIGTIDIYGVKYR